MTDALAVIERWSRARRYWGRPADPGPLPEWSVVIIGDVVTVFHGVKESARQWDIDQLTALLWASAVESGAVLDVGPCPACGGEGHQHWGKAPDQTDAPPWQHLKVWVPGVGANWQSPRRCHSCRPSRTDFPGVGYWLLAPSTGREHKPLALLVCESECSSCRGDGVERSPGHVQTRPRGKGWRSLGRAPFGEPRWERDCQACGGTSLSAREALTVAADQLLAAGESLGEWMAAWLRGECQACCGTGGGRIVGPTGHLESVGCESCGGCGALRGTHTITDADRGHGVILGAHVVAMTIALDQLSSEHELAAVIGPALGRGVD